MYQLYIDKTKLILKVKPLDKHFVGWIDETQLTEDTILTYNDNYKMSKNRKVLVQHAREIKALWLAEAQMIVQKIEEIKI